MSYQHHGDRGKSQLGKVMVPKNHPMFIILGQVDMLNAHLSHSIDLIQYDRTQANIIVVILFVFSFMLPWYTLMVMTLLMLLLLIYGQYLQSKVQQDTVMKLKRHCAIMIRLGGILSLSEGSSFYDFRSEVLGLDLEIHNLTTKTPKLKNFIYLHGGLPVSQLHITRTTCRYLELNMWGFKLSADPIADIVSDNMIAYINRLSLYLYHLTRYYNFHLHYGDQIVRF